MVRACGDDGAGACQTQQPSRPLSPELASIEAMENGLALAPEEVGPSGPTQGIAHKHAAGAALTDSADADRMLVRAEAAQVRAPRQVIKSKSEGAPRRACLKDSGPCLGSSSMSCQSVQARRPALLP